MPQTPPARTVLLSYPADLSDWGRDIVEGTPFRAYLRRAHESATVGDEWAEFVGVGCCGDSLDVPLRVEAVDAPGVADGSEAVDAPGATDREDADRTDRPAYAVDETTAFSFEERAECAVEGGWEVQSHAGP